MTGFIVSYRKMWDHPIFRGYAWRVGVWDWMLKKAAWKKTSFIAGGKKVELERGQLCISQRQMEEETGVGRKAIRNFLDLLESEGAISRAQAGAQRGAQCRTIVTIRNYNIYQRGNDEGAQGGAQSGAQGGAQKGPIKEQGNNIPPSEDAAPPAEFSIVSTVLWQSGKTLLARYGVKNPGGVIGRWRSRHDDLEIIRAIEAAHKSGTEDPVPYITAALQGRSRKETEESLARRRRWERMGR